MKLMSEKLEMIFYKVQKIILQKKLNSIKQDIKDIQIDKLQINVEYNKNNKIVKREQKIFILGLTEMLKNLNYEEIIQFGVDFIFNIIPNT